MGRSTPAAGVSRRRPPLRCLVAPVAATLLLTGCMLPGRRAPVTPAGPLDAPAIPAASPTVPATSTPLPTLASGPCTNAAEFLADDTIPDGTVVEPGAPLDKKWRVRNSGTCDWGPGYTLVHVNGPSMGAEEASALFPARAGAEIEIRLQFTAPPDPGEHTTTWRMRDAQGQLFGDTLFMTIVVSEPG